MTAITKPGVIGYTISCRSGRVFDYAQPHPDMLDIEDIAWGLARTGRYAGQLRDDIFYSVAQHSCLVADNLPPELRLQGLLHDASEAYTGDMPGPLKMLCPDFKRVEKRIELAIALKFGLPQPLDPAVKHADLRALHTEKLAFVPDIPGRGNWGLEEYPPFQRSFIKVWGFEQSALNFLDRFYRYTGREI